MNQTTEAAKIVTAQVLGQQSFVNGKAPVAAHDPRLLELLKGNKVGEGIPVLKAWNRGWHEANAAADIQ